MARTIIPMKIIINLDSGGNVSDAILQYKVNTDGVVSPNASTVSVRSAVGEEALSSLLESSINSAKESEGIGE